jgi:hypothetical protein
VSSVSKENLRAFLSRDWDLARRIKDERVARRVRAEGATAAFRLAQMLLDQTWERVRRDRARRSDLRGLLAFEAKLAYARAKHR